MAITQMPVPAQNPGALAKLAEMFSLRYPIWENKLSGRYLFGCCVTDVIALNLGFPRGAGGPAIFRYSTA
jgi:hypothetical protein